MRLEAPLPGKQTNRKRKRKKKRKKTPTYLMLLQTLFKELETKSLKIKKMYQLPSIKLQDEPQLGKPFSVGIESDLEKLFLNV